MRWLVVFTLAVILGVTTGGCIFPYWDGDGERHHDGDRRGGRR